MISLFKALVNVCIGSCWGGLGVFVHSYIYSVNISQVLMYNARLHLNVPLRNLVFNMYECIGESKSEH